MLDSDKEEITGISRLSTGLNQDAISKQNSADMVSQLVSLSQIRQRIVARQFAEGFLTDLYREVYALVVENEDRKRIVQLAGAWAEIDPTNWPDRDKLEVEFALGYGEQEREAQKWQMIDSYLSQPNNQTFYSTPKKFNVLSKALQHLGVRDVTNYLLTPREIQPPQPNPLQVAQLETQKADAAIKQAQAQATIAEIKLKQQQAELESQVAIQKLILERMKLEAHIAHQRDQLAHAVAVDAAEITLQDKAQAWGHVTAVAEPK
jgi:hypothetical protein